MVFNCYGFHIPQNGHNFPLDSYREIQHHNSEHQDVSTCKNQLVGCFESDLKILSEIGSSPQFPRYPFRNASNHHVCHKNYHLQHTKFGRLANICGFATGPYRYLFEAKHLKEVLCFVFLYRKTAIFGFRKCSLEDPSRNWIPCVVLVFF